jgi:hypothetical protein
MLLYLMYNHQKVNIQMKTNLNNNKLNQKEDNL